MITILIRNSTVVARRMITSLSTKRKVFYKYKDSFAASIILQSFIDDRDIDV